MGMWALNGDGRADRKTISTKPFNLKNTLSMKSNHIND